MTYSGTIKKRIPNLNVNILTERAMKLEPLLRSITITYSYNYSYNWRQALKDIEMLKDAIDCSIDYLKQKVSETIITASVTACASGLKAV